MRSLKFAVLAAGVAAIFVSKGFGAPITVANASFETPGPGGLPLGCGVNCSYSTDGVIPGWVSNDPGNSGEFQPGPPATTAYFNSVPDGITVAYTNVGDITQTTAATVQLGVTYTLLVDVGVRKDLPGLGVEYLVIGGGSGTLVQATGVLPPPGSGSWATFTATYIGLLADVGKTIGIDLRSNGAQGDWDNVRLSDSTAPGVPEPASLSLIGLGLAGLAVLARRRRV